MKVFNLNFLQKASEKTFGTYLIAIGAFLLIFKEIIWLIRPSAHYNFIFKLLSFVFGHWFPNMIISGSSGDSFTREFQPIELLMQIPASGIILVFIVWGAIKMIKEQTNPILVKSLYIVLAWLLLVMLYELFRYSNKLAMIQSFSRVATLLSIGIILFYPKKRSFGANMLIISVAILLSLKILVFRSLLSDNSIPNFLDFVFGYWILDLVANNPGLLSFDPIEFFIWAPLSGIVLVYLFRSGLLIKNGRLSSATKKLISIIGIWLFLAFLLFGYFNQSIFPESSYFSIMSFMLIFTGIAFLIVYDKQTIIYQLTSKWHFKRLFTANGASHSVFLIIPAVYIIILSVAILDGIFKPSSIYIEYPYNALKMPIISIIVSVILLIIGFSLFGRINIARLLFFIFVPMASITYGSTYAHSLWIKDMPYSALMIVIYIPLVFLLSRKGALKAVGLKEYNWKNRGGIILIISVVLMFVVRQIVLQNEPSGSGHGFRGFAESQSRLNDYVKILVICDVLLWNYLIAFIAVSIPTSFRKKKQINKDDCNGPQNNRT